MLTRLYENRQSGASTRALQHSRTVSLSHAELRAWRALSVLAWGAEGLAGG